MNPGADGSGQVVRIIGARVDPTTYAQAVSAISASATTGSGALVCCANVHMVVESRSDARLREAMERALLVTPDGMPLRWALRLLGRPLPDRVYGPELAWRVLDRCAADGVPVAFFGGRPEMAEALLQAVRERQPTLRVACAIAPPFGPALAAGEEAHVSAIAASGAQVVLVGLGCPRQEHWMLRNVDRIPAVMIGVGAFFDFASGRVVQAPRWMQRCGLEWLYRLWREPRRLGLRYLRTNPRFVALLLWQLLGCALHRR